VSAACKKAHKVRIFEMPLAGFLGFGPFAWEYFPMYSLARCLGLRKRHERRLTGN
jgi:hypothetical protein